MIQNPIHKVLSTLATYEVRALLMGGQACVLYGAAEFSRDTDIALLASNKNLEVLKEALRALQANRIALPPFDISFLLRGHAIHFRCYHPEAHRIRIDVMSIMRGVDAFEKLWHRRIRHDLPQGEVIDLLSLPDLVRTKKTQRDKDWPMIRRLIEADYANTENPTLDEIRFWLMESRTPQMLVELAQKYRKEAEEMLSARPLLADACSGRASSVEDGLEKEQKLERDADRQYWLPLFNELEALRHQKHESEEAV